jgi:hypothetical protein
LVEGFKLLKFGFEVPRLEFVVLSLEFVGAELSTALDGELYVSEIDSDRTKSE